MIALIVAMQKEAARVVSSLNDARSIRYASRTFYEGRYKGENVVVALAGIGKVAAAATTAIIAEKYAPDAVINTGIAGGLCRLKPLDVLVAEEVWQHDFDLRALGEEDGLYSGDADDELKNALVEALPQAYVGNVVTGDVFIADADKAAYLADTYDAKACDMECGAVAYVCKEYGIPFAAIKVISDGADDGANIDYDTLAEKACAINADAVLKVIEAIGISE